MIKPERFFLTSDEVEKQLEIDEISLREALGSPSSDQELNLRRVRLSQGDIGFQLGQSEEQDARELFARQAEILQPVKPFIESTEDYLVRLNAVRIAIENGTLRHTFGEFLKLTGKAPDVPPTYHQPVDEQPKN